MTVLLLPDDWRAREAAHRERADAFTQGWRARQQTGALDAVEDFLFTYYPFKPALLRRWHPGSGQALANAAGDERAGWRWYLSQGDTSFVDARGFLDSKPASIDFIERLMSDTRARPAQFSCFGLHEWAMVYRLTAEQVRHKNTPLRLSLDETNSVVDQHKIACSHFDAYRFFTPDAAPLNQLSPSRVNQPLLEQAGCLHAGMDVYKWVTKLGPLIEGELLLDSFELARDIRVLDMRASPYDVSAWGLGAITIETDDGKAEYVRQQRQFTARSNALRQRVLAAIAQARTVARTSSYVSAEALG